MDEILIEQGIAETRVALIDRDRLCEVIIEAISSRSLVGDIFLGRVSRVVPGVRAAFVDIGLSRDGFLAVADAPLPVGAPAGEDAPPLPIGQCVHEGQELPVQVVRDASEDKGVRVSAKLSLPGRRLVSTPGRPGLVISRRIEDAAERARLGDALAGLAEPGEGFIVRTAAEGSSRDELAAEAERLRALWRRIGVEGADRDAPGCVHRELEPARQALRDHAGKEMRIRVGSAAALAEARRYCADWAPELTPRLELYAGPGALFDLYDVDGEIEAALEPCVPLPSGGSLCIEDTRALTAIDVNSGAAAEARSDREAALRTNLEAAREAARQIRLRAIGGLIVIDFIQMTSRADRDRVMGALAKAVKADRAPLRLSGLDELGLAVITRKRVAEPLSRRLTEPCSNCESGRVKRAAAVAAEILRRAEREAAAARGELKLRAAPEVAAVLGANGGRLVAGLEQRLGRAVALEADEGLRRDHYEVVVG